MTATTPTAGTPTVSFVVPCYNLAHLLPECVGSILSQTYGDLEVLIMDDASPDHTAEVARSFRDPRVIHVRNDPNLGHLRNYNKGIGLARGRYVWLISADDYLRRPYILQRYLDVLERHPRVGYAFCAGVGVTEGVEGDPLGYSVIGDADEVIPGRTWLKQILRKNVVLAASGLVRRECYERYGSFPLDMPWAGDWYLWSLFALYYDVAYLAEPMVCYREHPLSMTRKLTATQADACCAEEVAIPWIIRRKAEALGDRAVARDALEAAAEVYVRCTATRRFGLAEPAWSLERADESLAHWARDPREAAWIGARVRVGIADDRYWHGDVEAARRLYAAALRADPWLPRVQAKRALLSLGPVGRLGRTLLRKRAQS